MADASGVKTQAEAQVLGALAVELHAGNFDGARSCLRALNVDGTYVDESSGSAFSCVPPGSSRGWPRSASSFSMRWLVHRWRSTSRSQPRAAASRASVSSTLQRARSRGAYSGVVTNLAPVR
jgi:hypothetical protein